MQSIAPPHQGLPMFHHDPRDPPVKLACTPAEAQKGRDAMNAERARTLQQFRDMGEREAFDACLFLFFADDEQIIWAMPTPLAAYAAVRLKKRKQARGQAS